MKKFVGLIIILIIALVTGTCYLHQYKSDRTISSTDYKALEVFNDLNPRQLKAAKEYGIKPVKNRKEAQEKTTSLVYITSNDLYKVDRLTHSIPYLTKGADELLNQIAKNFQDSLKSKGYAEYRIIVTSVLRTQKDVERLRASGNKNASKNSAHTYATTFDITYARYDRINTLKGIFKKHPSNSEMKMILAEVLKDLRLQQKCYVKYELGQRCFHITSRIKG